MKIVATSDTHGRDGWKIPPCDVFIHAGDMTVGGSLDETKAFAKMLRENGDFKRALIVPGNHDRVFQEDPEGARALFDERVDVLIDRAVEIGGKVFYGSPWTPPFNNWWFMADEKKLHLKYLMMPQKVDVLITHGPPKSILDRGSKTPNDGSEALYWAVDQRQVGVHVFGHLHASGGKKLWTKRTTFYNVAACNEAYQIAHKPLELDI